MTTNKSIPLWKDWSQKNLIKLIEKQMMELESTTDRDRLCMLTLDRNALSYPSVI